MAKVKNAETVGRPSKKSVSQNDSDLPEVKHSTRAEIAKADKLALELEETIAEKNLSAGGQSAGRGRPQQPSAKLPKAIDTRAEIATIAGVSHDTVAMTARTSGHW